jgi:hypothetical protein
MDSNPFLKNFMRMRQSLQTNENVSGSKGNPGKRTSSDVATSNITMATIIEEKPKDKVIIEYFKRRCIELNQD